VKSKERACLAVFLGTVEYLRAVELQMQVSQAKKQGFEEDVLLFLEHPPTITLGRNGKWAHLLVSGQELSARGVACFESDRGGDITFHGPGQLVGYPILQLEREERDVRRYMRGLEEALIRVLADYGIVAARQEGLTGVWTSRGKIAALGVHISRWITRHGFALNISTDLSCFDWIIPCGVSGRGVVSMSSILGLQVDLGEVAKKFVCEFDSVFGRKTIWVSEDEFKDRLSRYAREVAVA
jgi:lipoyl(octanoyl) transferase